MTILKNIKPIARKEHFCDFCGGRIKRGQQYLRQTNVIDGEPPYDFICHTECTDVAKALGLYQDCDPDYGVTDEMFMEEIYEYVRREHYDEERDDIAEEWDIPLYEQVVKIHEELEVGKQK